MSFRKNHLKHSAKKDRYFMEMLDAERKYRVATGGDDADEPFITPVLFSISDTLDLILRSLFFFCGAILTALLLVS